MPVLHENSGFMKLDLFSGGPKTHWFVQFGPITHGWSWIIKKLQTITYSIRHVKNISWKLVSPTSRITAVMHAWSSVNFLIARSCTQSACGQGLLWGVWLDNFFPSGSSSGLRGAKQKGAVQCQTGAIRTFWHNYGFSIGPTTERFQILNLSCIFLNRALDSCL